VGAPVVRVIEHIHVAWLHAARVFTDHGLDALAHRAQVHRHVRRVGDQVPLGTEQRTRKVQPLLDVDRVGGVLQLQAHLLGDVHEQVIEHLQQHRIDRGAHRKSLRARHPALQHDVVQFGHAGRPFGLDHRGRVLLGNDGRALHLVAGAQVFAHHQRGLVPGTAAVQAHGFSARHFAC